MTDGQDRRLVFAKAGSDLQSEREPGRLAGLGTKFLFLALLYVVLAACGVSAEQLTATDSMPEAQAQTTLPTSTATISPSPSPTPTPSTLPTETLVPTPTSEPMPSTCLDPGANEQVKQDFLRFRGVSSLDDVLSDVTRSEGFAGLENGPSWYIFSDLKVLGGYRISLEGQQGFGKGDFANCLIAAQPRLGEENLIPIVVGVQRRGEWSQTAALSQRSFDLSSSVPGEGINLYSPEEADRWIESLRGEEEGREIEIHPLVIVRFDKPDWDGDPLAFCGYDHVLPLLRREEGGGPIKLDTS